MSGTVMDHLAKKISKDRQLREIAARATKKEVDRIYGYPKYDLEEVSSELYYRLYNVTYLGSSVNGILDSKEVDEDTKVELAKGYLDVALLCLKGELPKKAYKYWDDAEPVYTVEVAVFLDQRNKYDWSNLPLLEGVLAFARESSLRTKKSFLSSLIDRINRDERLLLKLSSEGLYAGELYSMLGLISQERRKQFGLHTIEKSKLVLLQNLSPLLASDSADSSAELLCNLSCLTGRDLSEIFTGVPLFALLLGRADNRVVFYERLLQRMVAREYVSLLSLTKALAERVMKDGFNYEDEARVKALTRVTLRTRQESQELDQNFLMLIHSFLKCKMETQTRFYLLKFIYEYGEENVRKEILEEAFNWKSAQIRDWAQRMMKERLQVPVSEKLS